MPMTKKRCFKVCPLRILGTTRTAFSLPVTAFPIGFSYERENKAPARFSVLDRSLVSGLRVIFAKSLSRPITSGFGLNIQKWNFTTSPKLNGVPLKLMPNELSRSLAIAPGGKNFYSAPNGSCAFLTETAGKNGKSPPC